VPARCPGQDTRYWGPDDITEANCASCGTTVEFFKTDGSRRCPGCGQRVSNPNVSLGCAQWCEQARECLGFDPKTVQVKQTPETSVAERLIGAVKDEFGDDSRRVKHALSVLEHARAILREEPGDPRVVVAAALLHDIGIPEAERKHASAAPQYQEEEGPPVAGRIMERLGFDASTTEHVCRIVGSHHSGGDVDSTEYRIVCDADLLVNLSEQRAVAGKGELPEGPELAARTEAGKKRVRALLADDTHADGRTSAAG